MAHKSFADRSRENWGRDESVQLTTDELKLGALLRIASATEAMAKRHLELIDRAESAEALSDYWFVNFYRITRKNSSLRGQITKLKNAAKKAAP